MFRLDFFTSEPFAEKNDIEEGDQKAYIYPLYPVQLTYNQMRATRDELLEIHFKKETLYIQLKEGDPIARYIMGAWEWVEPLPKLMFSDVVISY
jgi:hypothetical protein